MRRCLYLVLAGAAFATAPATAGSGDGCCDPPCRFTVAEPDVQIDPDGPHYVTITPRYPQYTC